MSKKPPVPKDPWEEIARRAIIEAEDIARMTESAQPDLPSRLLGNALAIERTIQSAHDRSLVALLREAAKAIDGKRAAPGAAASRDQDEWSKSLADTHLAYLSSAEFRAIHLRLFACTATDADLLTYIATELREAQDCLEPNAPANGRVVDGWHASACVLRAWATLTHYAPLWLDRLVAAASADVTIYELRKHLKDLEADPAVRPRCVRCLDQAKLNPQPAVICQGHYAILEVGYEKAQGELDRIRAQNSETRSPDGDGPVSSCRPTDRTSEPRSAGAGSEPAESHQCVTGTTGPNAQLDALLGTTRGRVSPLALEALAEEILQRIESSRTGHIGSVGSTYMAQIAVDEVTRWRARLRAGRHESTSSVSQPCPSASSDKPSSTEDVR